MELAKGLRRWVVDISKWNPCHNHFSFFMSLLPQHEHSSITRFVKLEDRKRALVSRLLQYAIVHQVLGIPFNEIIIRRTAEGKPYLEFIQNFSSYFSSLEWRQIISVGSLDEKLKIFYRYWCLKEAYVKAIGTGVGHRLDDVEFHHMGWKNISVKVAGKELKDWKFWLLELDQHHSLSICRGHPRTAVESYKRTLKQTEFDDDMYNIGLHLPNSSFIFLTVEDLAQIHCNLGRLSPDLSRNHLNFKNGDYDKNAKILEL